MYTSVAICFPQPEYIFCVYAPALSSSAHMKTEASSALPSSTPTQTSVKAENPRLGCINPSPYSDLQCQQQLHCYLDVLTSMDKWRLGFALLLLLTSCMDNKGLQNSYLCRIAYAAHCCCCFRVNLC